MPSSMTAFARLNQQQEWGSACWEIRSVNHRYLEMHFRIPDNLRELEMPLRELVRKHLQRGKIDINLQLQTNVVDDSIEINNALATKIIQAEEKISTLMTNPASVSPMDILSWPGVLKAPEVERELLHKDLLNLFEKTLEQLKEGRLREGEKLKAIINLRLTAINEYVAKMQQLMPELLAAQKQKLSDRLTELRAEIDHDRIEQEMVILAHKADVDEELDRLNTHVEEIHRVLNKNEPAGRRLDFLMQELNREANTLGSKSTALATTQTAVELKVLIEQIREQIQNIE